MENIIYAYTRKQAIEDGEQVDVSTTAAEAGMCGPLDMDAPEPAITVMMPDED